MSACYQTAERCTDGPQPGARALMRAILELFSTASSSGIYNCRPVNHPDGRTTLSVHSEGRAGDVSFPGASHPDGTRLASVLVSKADELGVQFVIWNRRKWGCSYDGQVWPRNTRAYGGYPHTDHVHWELTRLAAKDLSYAKARRVLQVAVDPTEDEMTPAQEAKLDRALKLLEGERDWDGLHRVAKALYLQTTDDNGNKVIVEHLNVIHKMIRELAAKQGIDADDLAKRVVRELIGELRDDG